MRSRVLITRLSCARCWPAMKLYVTDKQVPELSGISRQERRVVRRGGYELFCEEKPSRRTKVRFINLVALLSGLFLAREFGHGGGAPFWLGPLIVAATVVVIEIPFQSYLTERLRPYFRRYLQDHQHELQGIG